MTLKRIIPAVGITIIILALAHVIGSGLYRRPCIFATAAELNRADCRIGVVDESAFEKIARAEFPEAQVVPFADADDASAALLAGRIEAFVDYEHTLNRALRAYPQRFRILDETLSRDKSVLLLSPTATNLLPQINRFIANFRRLGFYDDAYCRWCQSDTLEPMPEIPPASADHAVIRIGTGGITEPLSFYTDDGLLTGYDIEFSLRLAQYLRKRPEIRCAPREELMQAAASGTIDLVIDAVAEDAVPNGLVASEGYFDSDTRILVRTENRRTSAMHSKNFGYSSHLVKDPRLALFLSGFMTTLAMTILATAVGLMIAFLLRAIDRKLPIRGQVAVSVILEIFRLLPPPIVFLIFGCSGNGVMSAWISAVTSLALWFAADVEPMCGLGPIPMLSAVRTKLVGLMQWTSVVGCLNICDLAMAADIVCGRSSEALMPLVSVAAAYCLMNYLIKRTIDFLEGKFR